METFSALLAICVGNSPVPGEFPAQRPVTRSFDVFFDLRLNNPLSKQWWGWWFETSSRSLWRHCNVTKELIARWYHHTYYSPHGVVVRNHVVFMYKGIWYIIIPSNGVSKLEREIKFIGLFEDKGHRGPCSPYKPFNHNLYIGINIFPHIDSPQSTGYH